MATTGVRPMSVAQQEDSMMLCVVNKSDNVSFIKHLRSLTKCFLKGL